MAGGRRDGPNGRGEIAGARPALLSIGALSRATGLAVETLRTWERRYGFPVPDRKPSGHRAYPMTSVPRLRRIAAAVAQGHRAGDVVGASDDDLGALLGVLAVGAAPRPAAPAPGDADDLLALVARFDGEGLTRALNAEWCRLGPMAFLERRAAPLLHAVGTGWETGRLEVRHEHFLSERLCDLLRAYRLPYDERARGWRIVLATLPGEAHAIGLQMAALVVAMHGCRVCYVGTGVPVRELASVARDVGAGAVGVSVSLASRGARTGTALAKLRRIVPRGTRLVIGGGGAPRRMAGATIIDDLPGLADWAVALEAHA
jgi:methanogenic corrinoid protein MtbC1